MKFASWTCGNDGPDWGLVVRERLWSVPRLLSWAMRQGHPAVAGHGSSTLVEFLHAGGSPSGLAFLEVLFPQLPESDLDGQPFCVPLDGAALLPPVLHPPAFRDFYAFEQHV